jgi:hypothetical protein
VYGVAHAAHLRPTDPKSKFDQAIWGAALIAEVALWAAGAAGQGTRAAMDWLSAGQLAQMVEFCRTLANRMGRPQMPLLAATGGLLTGPGEDLRDAVSNAWQSLAPLEEALRHGAQAQPLDLRAWLASSALLAVSLPQPASMAHRQTAVALLDAAETAADSFQTLPEPTVWHGVDAPHPCSGYRFLSNRRCLVLASVGAGFASWADLTAANGERRQPTWMLGPNADSSAWEAVERRLGTVGIPPLSGGRALLVQDGGRPMVLTGVGA